MQPIKIYKICIRSGVNSVSSKIPIIEIRYTLNIFDKCGLYEISLSFVVLGILLFLNTAIELLIPNTPALHIQGINTRFGINRQNTIAAKPSIPKLMDKTPTENPTQNPFIIRTTAIAGIPKITNEKAVISPKSRVF